MDPGGNQKFSITGKNQFYRINQTWQKNPVTSRGKIYFIPSISSRCLSLVWSTGYAWILGISFEFLNVGIWITIWMLGAILKRVGRRLAIICRRFRYLMQSPSNKNQSAKMIALWVYGYCPHFPIIFEFVISFPLRRS